MRLTGGEIIAEYLIGEGVCYVVGIPGHGNLGLVDAFRARQDRLEMLQVRHEQAAVHLADGYYRVAGRPLAVFTSIGPGATNTTIGVATCYVDSTPVLVLTGDTHTHMMGRGVLQEIERTHWSNWPRVLEPIVKRWWRPSSPAQLPHVMHRAFAHMMTGRRGPVLISLPMDVQCDATDVEVSDPTERVPVGAPRPDPDAVARAAELLAGAKRPVILAGGGVLQSGATDELLAVAETLGAAVITTLQGKSAFPEDHPLAGWLGGSKGTTVGHALARNADVLLAVGCRFADETTSSYRHGVTYAIPPTRLVHMDIDPTEIGKNYPTEVGIVGDAKAALWALLEELSGRTGMSAQEREAYAAEIARLRAEWFETMRDFRESSVVPMTISRLLKELRACLAPDAIVCHSSGNVQAQILQEFCFTVPGTNLTTGGFSTMGWCFPAALGAKLAAPERQVVAVVGDGDFLMTIQELATAAQYQIPLVVIVANNVGWMAIRDLQNAAYGADHEAASEFLGRDGSPVSPDFAAIARGFGCAGERIERGEEVGPAVRRALGSGGPYVIEAMVNRLPWSAGKVTGWWDVPVPAYIEEAREKYDRERRDERLT
ncbi:MAG: thiamine pyrophosphate-binding protein [Armatimonadota bacterium]